MLYLFIMSNDYDIRNTNLNDSWGEYERKSFRDITSKKFKLLNGQTIIVSAHGNNQEIGDANDGGWSYSPSQFIDTIQGVMGVGAEPSKLYISACAVRLAEYAAKVRIEAEKRGIWNNTQIFGNHDAVPMDVPSPPPNLAWVEIT
jgi:hypothetical protein